MIPVRRLMACICCLAILLTLTVPAKAESSSSQNLLQQMLNYFCHHQTAAKTDIYRLLAELDEMDPGTASVWHSIFEYWFYATDELPKNNTELPGDLPQDESLCIVVLGYRLGNYGEMLPELEGRLALALRAAEEYPNAYILCTGGGTAAEAPGVTEARQMEAWLREQGIAEDRVIAESRSLDTLQNAKYSFEILAERYPQIRQLAIVTSDYHLTRSTTLFYAQSLFTSVETGKEPVSISACLGYEADHEGIAEDPLDQTAHLARLSGFEFELADQPALSRLTDISITGDTVLETGIEPQLTVTAHYDSGFSRDVTADCEISPFDPANERTQTLTVTYAENGSQIMASVEITRPPKETDPPVTEPVETVPATEAQAAIPEKQGRFYWLPAAAIAAAVLVILVFRKKE